MVEYWVVDPEGQGTVQVFGRDGPVFVSQELLNVGDALTYPRMRLAVADILAE